MAKPLASKPRTEGSTPSSPATYFKHLVYERLVAVGIGNEVMGEPIAVMYWASDDLTKILQFTLQLPG